MGCGQPPPKTLLVTEVEVILADIPADLLTCPVQPASPILRTQADAAMFMLALAEAGMSCRSKLNAVRELYRTQQEETPPIN